MRNKIKTGFYCNHNITCNKYNLLTIDILKIL